MLEKIGRPKKSADTERVCICGEKFTLPEWNPKKYCSRSCALSSRHGEKRGITQRIAKHCPGCDQDFQVYPSHHYVTCCSRECSGKYQRVRAAQTVHRMSEPEIAWFAGLFDGEGSIVRSQRSYKNGTGHFRIQITNTILPLLERARDFTGVGFIRLRKMSKKNPRWTDCYLWEVGPGEALEILRQVRPWLIVKAERADAVLEGRSFPRQARWDSIYSD